MDTWFTPHLKTLTSLAEETPISYKRRDNPKVKVQAWQLSEDNVSHIVWLTGGHQVEEIDPVNDARYVAVNVPSLGGVVRLSQGNWLVKLGERTFRVLSMVEFQRTYKED